MPLPTPRTGEKQNAFVSRCISFLDDEGSSLTQDQRVAACFSRWRKSKQMNKINLIYQVPIKETGFINGDFMIQGTALNAITTSNKHKFIAEELRTSASTLKGVPLLVDHLNEVKAIKGRVISGEFNEAEEKVDFTAKVMDEEIKGLIKDKRLNSVSIGADVEDIEETEEGLFIPHGIVFRELSLVAVPADPKATFVQALKEAYNNCGCPDNIQLNKQEVKQMSEEDAKKDAETEEPKEEAKEEKTEEPKEPEKPEEEKKEEDKTEETLKVAKELLAEIKKIKESDEDEVKPETKEEPKPEKEEVKADKEDKDEAEEEEETEETVDEKYKIVQSRGSIQGGAFTLVR